ncbi:TPA: hypothetical protein N0F65_001301 [Lagenidium giganteum]|uniref:Ubiquitin-like domain-containing protein n=1 Tax=Lagenidium giganteum TaxID=4803 RepID=A0AAV2Z335_9STRA|nr:TPA: hypothetical protein N0F65_001301 [Lagenidium giganteum]
MGRFLGVSPRASERGRRYAALPSTNSVDDDEHHGHDVENATPASTTSSTADDHVQLLRASNQSSSAVSAEQAEREEGRRGGGMEEREAEEEERAQLESVRSTSRMLATEEQNTAAPRVVATPAANATEDTSSSSSPNNGEEADEEAELEPGSIRVRILDLNGKFFNIVCQLDWTVAALKRKVNEATEVALTAQRLIYRGRVLEDDQMLSTYKVEDGHTIHLFVRQNQAPDPEILSAELNANGSSNGGMRMDDMHGMHVVHISSDTITSAVFPSDSARRVDPLMLDCALGNAARRVKLWSSFLLIIYTMKVMGQFALLANDQQMRQQKEERAPGQPQDPYERYDRFAYPPYTNQDPMISGLELLAHAFGVYVGCVGFKAAHDTDVRPIRFYCRGIVWLAIMTVAEQIYVTIQISNSDYPKERIQYPYGGQMPSKDDIVSANIFQTVMLVVMWIIAIHHAYVHQMEVRQYNQSFAQAAMNAMPPVALPADVAATQA